ncbi:MAG TPA: DinB family protein [Cyclobacteriaceae bacterium]|nr:DinB family protein [Cyclobacteriaceae bacterium]
MQPDLESLPPYYRRYAEQVKDLEIDDALYESLNALLDTVKSITEEKGSYRYDVDKWSIKEVLCHVIDAERIFTYRALRFARNDKTPLSGFEENDYAPEANADARTLQQITDEMKNLRAASIDLYRSFTPEMLNRKGSANNVEVSVKNLGYIIAGHMLHHRQVLLERYLANQA